VFLIRIILGLEQPIDAGAPKLSAAGELSLHWRADAGSFVLSSESNVTTGALALETRVTRSVARVELAQTATDAGMELKWHVEGDRLKILIYSLAGHVLPAGPCDILVLDGPSRPEVLHTDASDANGRVMKATVEADPALPLAFDLDPNIPNPFNPETEIRFSLHRDAEVYLAIYNVLGQPVAMLVKGERLQAGPHSYIWRARAEDGSDLPTGVYMYRLTADGYSEARKMLLLR
jgi:hypothetical protein